jgi:multicomponent Na+:H+ antiporter subunit E
VAVKLKFIDDYPRFGLSFLRYMGWLFKEVIISTIDVLKIIWSNNPITEAHFAEVKTMQIKAANPALGLTILGNSITLTPGTVCVRVYDDSRKIIAHALTKKGMDSLHEGSMDRRVLEALK